MDVKRGGLLSRKADYGVRAMIDIAWRSPRTRAVVSEIAERQGIPVFYLAKIIPKLARAGLVRTSLGATGGITLAMPADEISLFQIIEAIEGPFALNLCSVTPSDCERHTVCSACAIWGQAQAHLDRTLKETRLSDLAPEKASTHVRYVPSDQCPVTNPSDDVQ